MKLLTLPGSLSKSTNSLVVMWSSSRSDQLFDENKRGKFVPVATNDWKIRNLFLYL